MKSTGFLHLAWKEYRAVRAFWLSVVALVVLLQLLALVLTDSPTAAATTIFALAVGAPAFFALGCAGASFSVEQEEGTYDFLQASPIPARLILASKLAITAVATACLLAALMLLPALVARGAIPSLSIPSREIVGLWGMAALEAIAWGTFFSLLTARPLLAICLALVATITIVHLLAMSVWPGRIMLSDPAPYLAAVPRRALLTAVVLLVDIALGLRWLDHKDGMFASRLWSLLRRRARVADADVENDELETVDSSLTAAPLERDRVTMVWHLLWQHCRQSGWLMLLMAALFLGLTLSVIYGGVNIHTEGPIIPMTVVAALTGACVFLADQERRRYSFFVEHNVPPRYVWLSRQIPFALTIVLATSFTSLFWFDMRRLGDALLVLSSFRPYSHDWRLQTLLPQEFIWPPLFLGLTSVAVAYAAGQWASMHLRSGLLAGFVGVLLAGVLCGWALLINFMHESWFFFVLPVPLVLLWATWRRAPDWIRENSSAAARVKAAASVIVPAVCLVGLLAIVRVQGVPAVDPGFNAELYLAQITPEARQTADMYRRASDLYVAHKRGEPFREEVHAQKNAEALTLLLEASSRSSCVLDDPRSASDSAWLKNDDALVRLILSSADKLRDDGQLDEALDRYFSAVKMVSHLYSKAALRTMPRTAAYLTHILDRLPAWGARPGQTSERLKGAIERISKLDGSELHLADGVESDWVLLREFLQGNRAIRDELSISEADTVKQIQWITFLPWEDARELRLLNVMTKSGLDRLSQFRKKLNRDEATIHDLPESWQGPQVNLGDAWLRNDHWRAAMKGLVEFEDHRRATMILLALQAHRLDHGELPESLDALVGTYLDKLPLDPYAGIPCVYFPKGIPKPTNPLEERQFQDAKRYGYNLTPDVPAIWSTGPNLVGDISSAAYEPADEQPQGSKPGVVSYRERSMYWSNGNYALSNYQAWARGHLYTVPNKL